MSLLTPHQFHQWRILSELESGGAVSQRALARKLGIALGLTNRLVRELAHRRFISCSRPARGRSPVQYHLTSAGRRHREDVSRARMDLLVRAYGEARQRIQDRLEALSTALERRGNGKRVVFYDDGSGMSELGWMCLQRTGLQLVGIVGESAGSICNMPVEPCERLSGRELAGQEFDRLVVMSFGPAHAIRARLRKCGVERRASYWI